MGRLCCSDTDRQPRRPTPRALKRCGPSLMPPKTLADAECSGASISHPVISLHQHNERQRTGRVLAALAEGDVALVTDAGTPAVSDPGAVAVRAAREAGYRVVPIPGASALVAAVSASGLIDGPFLFAGFLPRSGEERRATLGRATAAGVPLVLFESPNRLAATLADLETWLGDVEAVVARELTKLHEEVVGGRLSALRERFGGRGQARSYRRVTCEKVEMRRSTRTSWRRGCWPRHETCRRPGLAKIAGIPATRGLRNLCARAEDGESESERIDPFTYDVSSSEA